MWRSLIYIGVCEFDEVDKNFPVAPFSCHPQSARFVVRSLISLLCTILLWYCLTLSFISLDIHYFENVLGLGPGWQCDYGRNILLQVCAHYIC